MLITSVLHILSERQFETRAPTAAKPQKSPSPAGNEQAQAGFSVDEVRQKQIGEIGLVRPILKTDFPSVIMPSPQGIQEILRMIEEARQKGQDPVLDVFE